MELLTMLGLSLFIFGLAKWANEGETQVGDIYLKKGTLVDLYLGLYTDATEPAEDATLVTISELPVANGYARIALIPADWSEGDPGVFTNLQKTFEASGGDWGDVYGYFLTDCASGTAGKLVAVENFSDGPYTVNDGWITKVTPKITIS